MTMGLAFLSTAATLQAQLFLSSTFLQQPLSRVQQVYRSLLEPAAIRDPFTLISKQKKNTGLHLVIINIKGSNNR